MKKIIALTIAAAVLIIPVGAELMGKKTTAPQKPAVTQDNNKAYSIVSPAASSIPGSVVSWFNSQNNKVKGVYIYQHPDYTYVKINAGQKNTGGYGIEVRNFKDNDYEKSITVEFTSPKPGSMVTEAITYPSILLKVKSNNISSYTVITTKGENLKVQDKVVFAEIYSPSAKAAIKSPVTIKGKVAAFEGSYVIRILNSSNKVIKETIGQTAGAPSWGSFENKISFTMPTTSKGYIVVGEFSAKDGEFISHVKREITFKK